MGWPTPLGHPCFRDQRLSSMGAVEPPDLGQRNYSPCLKTIANMFVHATREH